MKKSLLAVVAAIALLALGACSGKEKFNPAEDPEGSAEYLIKMAEDSVPAVETKLFGTLPSLIEQHYVLMDSTKEMTIRFYDDYLRKRTAKVAKVKEEEADSVLGMFYLTYCSNQSDMKRAGRVSETEAEIINLHLDKHPLFPVMQEMLAMDDTRENFRHFVDSVFMIRVQKEIEKIDTVLPVEFEKEWFSTARAVLNTDQLKVMYNFGISPKWESSLPRYMIGHTICVYGLNDKGEVIEEIILEASLRGDRSTNQWHLQTPMPTNPEVAKIFLSRRVLDVKGDTASEVAWTAETCPEFPEVSCIVNTKTGKGKVKIKTSPELRKEFGSTLYFYFMIDDVIIDVEGAGSIQHGKWNNHRNYYEWEFTIPAEYRKGDHKVRILDGRYA